MKEIKSWSKCLLKEVLIGKLDSTWKKKKRWEIYHNVRTSQGCTKTPTIAATHSVI